MQRANLLVDYSLREWLRYTEAGVVDPQREKAHALMSWMLHPERIASWRTFDKTRAGKSWPPAHRHAKKRDPLLDLLIKHKYLLSQGKGQYRINPLAESADSAEAQQSRGLLPAEPLRSAAASAQVAGQHPQPSARHPHAAVQPSCGLPQDPQIPQAFGGEL